MGPQGKTLRNIWLILYSPAPGVLLGACEIPRPALPNFRHSAGYARISTSGIPSSGCIGTDVATREWPRRRHTGLVFGASAMHIIYASVADCNVDGTAGL